MSAFAYRHAFSPANYGRPFTSQLLSNTGETFSFNNPLSMESNAALIGERAVQTVLPEGVKSLAELEMFARDHQSFLYTTVAVLCVLIYDYILTFDMELSFIWKARPRITMTNCLFFVNRYYPILRAIAFTRFTFFPPDEQAACDRWIDFNSYSVMVNVATGELLMFVRTWALWNQSRRMGIIMFGFFVTALGAVIAITRPSIPPAQGVIPLPPFSVLFCDRPSPFKYLYVYCVALVVEFTCVSFMFGRILYITNFSKVPPKLQSQRVHSRPTVAALPLLRTLQWHGTYYFLVVIFVILFTVISSFVRPLARAVVNSGMAPAATSIACNRAIFALRGFYLDTGDEFTHGTVGRETKPRDDIRFSDEFAETRRDLTTGRDLDLNNYTEGNKVSKDLDSKLRQLPTLSHSNQDQSQPQAYHGHPPSSTALTGGKTARLKLNFHAHGASSSSVMTSDGSSGHGRSPSSPQAPPVPPKPTREGEVLHQAQPGAIDPHKPSTRYPPTPGGTFTPGTSPTGPALGSLKRSLSGIMNAPSAANRLSSPTTTRPTLEEDLIRSGVEQEGLTERLGNMWGKRKGRRPEDTMDPGYNQNHNYNYNEDLNGERSTPKPKERHPLDHHYEMETIHSEILNEVNSDDTNMSRLTLDTGNSQHVHERDVEKGNTHDPGGDEDRAHAHTPTPSRPYVHINRHEHAHGQSRQRDLESGVFRGHESQELSPIVYSNNFRTYSADL